MIAAGSQGGVPGKGPMDVSVVVPMHNERDGVAALFAALALLNRRLGPRRSMEAVLVDDCSTDGTYDVAWPIAERAAFPARVIRINPQEGIGGALRHGFFFAVGTTIVTYDADLPYPIEDVLPMLDKIDAGADVVTASPYHESGRVEDVPASRLWVSRLASRIWRFRLGLGQGGIKTLSCGFRAYRKTVLLAHPHQSDGFLATTELIVRPLRAGLRVEEIPSVLRKRATGRSKMKVARTALAHLIFLLFRLPPKARKP